MKHQCAKAMRIQTISKKQQTQSNKHFANKKLVHADNVSTKTSKIQKFIAKLLRKTTQKPLIWQNKQIVQKHLLKIGACALTFHQFCHKNTKTLNKNWCMRITIA